jgi:acyl carrier protein
MENKFYLTSAISDTDNYLYKKFKEGIENMNYKPFIYADWGMNFTNKNKTLPEIKQVIFNPPATIIIWRDNSKTIVKMHNEDYDEEKGFAMAILKKLFGGRNQYMKYIKNATRQEQKKEIKKEKETTTVEKVSQKVIDKTINDVNLTIKIFEIIANHLRINESDITSKSNIISDLGADSLDVVELCMAFEDEFDIDIQDEEVEKLSRIVEDIVSFVIDKINN